MGYVSPQYQCAAKYSTKNGMAHKQENEKKSKASERFGMIKDATQIVFLHVIVAWLFVFLLRAHFFSFFKRSFPFPSINYKERSPPSHLFLSSSLLTHLPSFLLIHHHHHSTPIGTCCLFVFCLLNDKVRFNHFNWIPSTSPTLTSLFLQQ